MDLKVGIFGPDEVIVQAEKVFLAEDHVETLSFTCQAPEKIDQLIDQAFMSDVYIFLDPLIYYCSKKIVDKRRLPVVKVCKDEYALASTLFHLSEINNLSLERFSIDIGNRKFVKNILHDLKIDDESIYMIDYGQTSDLTAEQIVNFHLNLWKDQKIDFILTSSHYIYDRLKDLDVSVYIVNVPKKYFHLALERAKQLIHFKRHSIKRIVTGYIQLQHNSAKAQITEEVFTSVHHFLEEYQNKINTSLTFDGDNRFVLIGTQDFLSYVTDNLRALPLVKEIKERLPKEIHVHIGFGYGLNAYEAEKNAQIALENSLSTKGSSSFIVNEREEVIGPIGVKRSFNKPKLYNKLIHQARLNNQISYNFIQFISARNNEPFSSEDIAQFYKVTKRSAERTIKKLINGNVIIHVGEERPYIKGRPRKLFQLNDEILQ